MPDPTELQISNVPVALLAGGLATRLRPVTQTIPKAMVEIGGRPFIEHQIELLYRNGIRKIVLCLGHLGEQIQSHVGDGGSFGVEVSYCEDGKKLLGTGGAIRNALPLLGDPFWVMYGDSYMDIDYRAVLANFAGTDAPGLMTVVRNDNRWDRSNAIFRNGTLLRYDKRDRCSEMTYVDYGVQLLRRSAAMDLPVDQPADLADLYRDLVAQRRMIGFEVFQRFYEIGTPDSLEETRQYLNTVKNYSPQRSRRNAEK